MQRFPGYKTQEYIFILPQRETETERQSQRKRHTERKTEMLVTSTRSRRWRLNGVAVFERVRDSFVTFVTFPQLL